MNGTNNDTQTNGADVALVTKIAEMTQLIVLPLSLVVSAPLAASLSDFRNDLLRMSLRQSGMVEQVHNPRLSWRSP
jgi:hypothetical protein